MMRPIRKIVIHCSDSPDDRHVTAADINDWHVWPRYNEERDQWYYQGKWHKHEDLPSDVRGKRGNGWSTIGYHAVILRDGTVEQGRPLETPGAHVRGHNHDSIGICLIGRHEFTEEQMMILEGLVRAYKSRWPQAEVLGHTDLDPGKTCPNLNILEWYNETLKHT